MRQVEYYQKSGMFPGKVVFLPEAPVFYSTLPRRSAFTELHLPGVKARTWFVLHLRKRITDSDPAAGNTRSETSYFLPLLSKAGHKLDELRLVKEGTFLFHFAQKQHPAPLPAKAANGGRK
jgi:hypothetical protein